MEIKRLRVRKFLSKERLGLFLDSGAYSAHTRGVDIDVDAYIEFLKKHDKILEVYAPLDSIGDAEATYQNFKYMESKGVKPMPVYHQGEDEKYLVRYLEEGYDYIALGGLVGSPSSQIVPWLDRIFAKFLTDSKGWPLVRVHGFGITGFRYLWRYPWYSVDSTTWLKIAAFGSVLVPRKKGSGWDYNSSAIILTISERHPSFGELHQHYWTSNKYAQRVFDEYFTMIGFKASQLMEDVTCRKKANIQYYVDLERNFIAKPFNRGNIMEGMLRGE